MNVDLPAPLSPSTQVTSPAPTPTLTSFSATTLPKYFETLRTSSSGVPLRRPCLGGAHRRAPSARLRM